MVSAWAFPFTATLRYPLYIAAYGSDVIKDRWLPGCATGEVITAIGLTEPNTGSDLAAIRTRAVKDGDFYIINGQKTFITNGYFADLDGGGGQDQARKPGIAASALILVDKDTHQAFPAAGNWRRWDTTCRTRQSFFLKIAGFRQPISWEKRTRVLNT